MTNEEAKKMLEAKLKCFIAETSGTNHDCNMRLCDGCALNYEQGNMGEQKQALDMAIKALEQQLIDKSAMMYEIYMKGVNMTGEYQGCWVRFKDIEKIVDKYMVESEE